MQSAPASSVSSISPQPSSAKPSCLLSALPVTQHPLQQEACFKLELWESQGPKVAHQPTTSIPDELQTCPACLGTLPSALPLSLQGGRGLGGA